MFESIDDILSIDSLCRAVGLEAALRGGPRVLVKINLARPPLPAHPRTDARLLLHLLDYLLRRAARPALCESVAEGSLRENLSAVSLLDFVTANRIDAFEIDGLSAEPVTVDGDTHYLPRRFGDFPVRIAVPCASQREGMIFSNNVKLFIGAVPREHYTRPGEGRWRAKIHDRLDLAVKNVYLAVQRTYPFHFYINGGNAYWEKRGSFQLDRIYIGTDGAELDREIIARYFDTGTVPEYLRLLEDGRG
jgi:uncharacterized protein (DUF362 family)